MRVISPSQSRIKLIFLGTLLGGLAFSPFPLNGYLLSLRIPLANWRAMSTVRYDASPVVVAQGTMGIGLASSLFKPNRFVPIIGCIPERNTWLDPANPIPLEPIESGHTLVMFGFSH